jgi:serine/threonine protein kinase/WD40 repeat protein
MSHGPLFRSLLESRQDLLQVSNPLRKTRSAVDEKTLDEEMLKSLILLDEALRCGESGKRISVINLESAGSEYDLASSALLELEHALPRRISEMPSWAPQRIGRFEIRSVLGAGGFAVVYRAFDPSLHRDVALKVPRPHALLQPELRRRFITEAQAAARLDHSNILPVFEAGEDGDLPYISCTLCEGPTLAEWMSSRTAPMKPRAAARIVQDLARAIHYSHERGILHRDIKPGNVLLFSDHSRDVDEFPFVPRLSDFGLAKILGAGELDTVTSQLMGTPRFMAPELIRGGGLPNAVAPDVYGLGALLYCLITGNPPFRSATTAETLRQIVEDEPVSPALLDPSIGRDLSLICVKCLQKAPEFRYQSAEELSNDLDRYLAGMPVFARPTPWTIRLEKWCRRRPAVAALLTVSFVLMLAIVVFAARYTSMLTRLQTQIQGANTELSKSVRELKTAVAEANRLGAESERNRLAAREQVFAADLKLAESLVEFGDIRSAHDVLQRYQPSDSVAPKSSEIDGRISFAWRYLKERTSHPSVLINSAEQIIWDQQISPSGDLVAQCGDQGVISILSIKADLKVALKRKVAETEFNSISWCKAAPVLAVGGDDGMVRICSSDDLTLNRILKAFPGSHIYGVSFLGDTREICVGGESSDLQIWNTESGHLLRTITTPHSRGIESLAVSRDGTRIVTGGYEGHLCAWDMESGSLMWQQTLSAQGHTGPVSIVRLTPDERFIVAAANRESIVVLTADTGNQVRRWTGLDRIHSLVVTDNSHAVFGDSGGVFGELKIDSEVGPWQPIRRWVGQNEKVSSLVVLQGGDRGAHNSDLLSCDRSGQVIRWLTRKTSATRIISGHPPSLHGPAHWICWKNNDAFLRRLHNTVECVDVQTGEKHKVYSCDSVLTGLHYVASADEMILCDDTGRLFSVTIEGDLKYTLAVSNGTPASRLSVDSAGTFAALFTGNSELAVVDLRARSVRLRLPDREDSCVSPDGRWVATASRADDVCEIYDCRSLQKVAVLSDIDPTYEEFAFSGDSKWFLSMGSHRAAFVWDTSTWKLVNRIAVPAAIDFLPKFHPDHRTVAAADSSGRIRLLDIVAGRELLTLDAFPHPPIRALSFSPDGKRLAVGRSSLEVYVISN